MRALAGAILLDNRRGRRCAGGLVAALALYRALLFIHELTHIHRDALPGFRTRLEPARRHSDADASLMYEDVHTLHHARTRYGTRDDPEYLPLGADEAVVAAAVPAGRRCLHRWGC